MPSLDSTNITIDNTFITVDMLYSNSDEFIYDFCSSKKVSTTDTLNLTTDSTIVTSDYSLTNTQKPTVDQYVERITAYYRNKPRFVEMMKSILNPLVTISTQVRCLIAQFDLDQAVGVQLDAVGEWVGLSRRVTTPIPGVYFSFDIAGLGWDLGYWKGPYDNETGLTVLDDETYRTILRARIASNHWDGTLQGAKDALALIYPGGETRLFIVDNGDMTMTFGVSGIIPSVVLIALLSDDYVPLKPEGVRADYLITTVNDYSLFGFDIDNEYVKGWDEGAWGATPEYFNGQFDSWTADSGTTIDTYNFTTDGEQL